MINIKMLLVELGYGETTWKASRTRILKKLEIENPNTVLMVTEEVAQQIIETVSEVKTKTLQANLLLGSKKYLEFTEVLKDEKPVSKPKATTSGTTTVKGKSQKEVENDNDIKKIVIRDLKKENIKLQNELDKMKEKIKELESLILKETMKNL